MVSNPVSKAVAHELRPDLEARIAAWRDAQPEKPVAVYLGGLYGIKGSAFLAKTWRCVGEKSFRLVVAGQFLAPERGWMKNALGQLRARLDFGNSSARIRRLWKRYETGDSVYFAGFVESPEALLMKADVLIVPFTEPHFARPILEAAAVGCSTVAARIGGITGLIEDGLVSFPFMMKDKRSFGEALSQFRCSWQPGRRCSHEVRRVNSLDPAEHARAVAEFFTKAREVET